MRPRTDPSPREEGPGVPQATAMALRRLSSAFPPGALRRVWLFPPLVKGRREQGLVAGEVGAVGAGRARLVTLRYRAEERGAGVSFQPELREEGEVPTDRFAAIMQGVVRRSGLHLGEPREVVLGDEGEAWEELLVEFDSGAGTSPSAASGSDALSSGAPPELPVPQTPPGPDLPTP